jgi:hypothetical protein
VTEEEPVSHPGITRPDLCSMRVAAEQAEHAEAARSGLTADDHPPADYYPPEPLTSGTDRAIRLSTAAAMLAVAGIAAYVSYGHAYAVVRAHGETGITARLEPATIDGLVYASSMVVLYAARHRVPVPSLARWLLALGIAATLTANMAQGWSHGLAGAVVAALAGGQPGGLVRASGLAHPHTRADSTRAVGSAAPQRCGLPCRGASSPGLSQCRRALGRERARHVRPGAAARGSDRRAAARPRQRTACR